MNKLQTFRNKLKEQKLETNLTCVNDEYINELTKYFPDLPLEYKDFLKQIGWGSFGNMAFKIYGTPLDSDEIYDPNTAKQLEEYIFIGDDYFGWYLGYDKSKSPYELVLFNHSDKVSFDESKKKKLLGFLHYELFER